MTRISGAMLITAVITFFTLFSQDASAETIAHLMDDQPPAKSSEVKTHRAVSPQELRERSEVPFMEKPGSGWIIGSIPVLSLGTAATVAGAVMSASTCTGDLCGIGTVVGMITLFSGLAVAGAGAGMVGYGVVQNNHYADGTMDYISPATGYIAGGAINAAIGLGAMIAGGVATSPTSEGGIYLLAGGSVFAAYGLAFGLYGGLKDFSRNSKESAIEKTFRSLTPYIGCAGGMCDGNISKTTGRETYFGGLRGEF